MRKRKSKLANRRETRTRPKGTTAQSRDAHRNVEMQEEAEEQEEAVI